MDIYFYNTLTKKKQIFVPLNSKEVRIYSCAAWEKYIEPIVGDTETLCYPAGKHNAASAKNGIFKKHGFKVFLCVGDFDGTEEERADVAARYVYRLPFDGTALRLYGKRYARMADVRAIYDSARFRPFSYKGFYH